MPSLTTPRRALLALALTALLPLSACGAPDAPVVSARAAAEAAPTGDDPTATLRPGDDVPPPEGKVVLVVRGGSTTNAGDTLRLDLEQLEAMGTVSYTVDDAQATGHRATFSGPLLRTVLAVAGADGRTIHAAALNDYAVDVPTSDARDLPVILATRMDGKPMSVAHYGPTRVVYPTEGYDLDEATYGPRWIWQVKSLTVR